PAVKFVMPLLEQTSQTDFVTLEAAVTDQGGGIGRAEWRIISRETAGRPITVGVVEKPAGVLRQSVALDPGENIIELVAYNSANLVSSLPASARIHWNNAEASTPPRLFVVVVGINEYADNALRLNYAVPDARAIASAFQEAGRDLYQEVSVTLALDSEA